MTPITYCKSYIVFKEQSHEIFDLCIFLKNIFPCTTVSHPEMLSHNTSNSPRYSNSKLTHCHRWFKKISLGNHIFYAFVSKALGSIVHPFLNFGLIFSVNEMRPLTSLKIDKASFDLSVSMTPLSFGTDESWLSGIIGDLKLQNHGEFATIFTNISGCEPEA